MTLTSDRIEVTAIRVDGTTIETTTWADGPAPSETTKSIAGAGAGSAVAAGASTSHAPAAPIAPAISATAADDESTGHGILWIGLGGAGLLLAAAVVLVRTLRR